MIERPAKPRRQNSSVSTASSGNRTIRAKGRRRSSASTTLPSSSGLFARLTGRDKTDTPSDSDSTPRESDNEAMIDRQEAGGELNEENAAAGPSDYWRRSPSPSSPTPPWVTSSTQEWSDKLGKSNHDAWRPHDSPGTGVPFTPPFKLASQGRSNGISDGGEGARAGEIGTPDVVDETVYERRMRDVFDADTPSSPRSIRSVADVSDGSPGPSALEGTGGAGMNGKDGAYESAYREVLEEKDSGGIGEEEFGTFKTAHRDDASDATPSSISVSMSGRPGPSPLKRPTPYLHPSVSRLRSHLRTVSSATQNSTVSFVGKPSHTRLPSHFSQISLTRSASASTLSILPGPQPVAQATPSDQSPAFSFHPLRSLSAHLFSKRASGRSSPARPVPSRKPSAQGVPALLLSGEDTSALVAPTVLDVRGMIAVGTLGGYVIVYSFGQEIKHVLGTEVIAKTSGIVTAVTISSDMTYIGVGHASGNIYLYDLSNPTKPARTSLALTPKQVLSGRKEGHLQGSRILHIGFVGARHTSIVSGDEHGRAFWWSLGKVIGVESNDVVRMLGSYPEANVLSANADSGTSSYPSKRPTTLFGANPLPLGERPHSADSFNFTALLTPVKLVVVGMKPSAKTWYRKMRNDVGGEQGGVAGCVAWLRSGELEEGSDPVLAYSWGHHVRFLRIKMSLSSPVEPNGKAENIPEFVEGRRCDMPGPVLALQWFDANHLLCLTASEIVLLDVRTGQPVETTPLQTRLLTANDFHSGLGARRSDKRIPDSLAGSVRVHRGKLFLLTRSNVQVGSLLHWNDRILARVHAGDFLDAIQVALSYYESRAAGNYIGLPENKKQREEVVGARIRELIRASLDWAFSEDRMRDDTHYTPDGRGVDLTSLFEGLAKSCIDACLSMEDTQLLFDDAYEAYANAGIQGIFLNLLEPNIFDGHIREIPPTIIKALISMHEDRGELDMAEGLIWHVDPVALDINQAVTLCEEHGLWDALIHVYTRAMKDYKASLVKLISLVAEVDKQRQARLGHPEETIAAQEEGAADAYRIFAYIEAILSGISYPSSESLPSEEADFAKSEVYGFIFSDRLITWPEGHDGRLVLPQCGDTAYPYLDLLLRFDMEAFLHSMDIAFEDSYLNDSNTPFSRQTIINMMLDRMDPSVFHTGDITLLHIFVSRNLPKYPQFLFIPPTTLQHILISLGEDPDQSTREDRQLAAEYLLSAYTPSDFDKMLALFEKAGFWRILRTAYRREKQWKRLINAYVSDPEMDLEVFDHLDEILRNARTKGTDPKEVKAGVEEAIPALLDLSVRQSALLIDSRIPDLHPVALQELRQADHKRMAYLRCLLQPEADEDDRGQQLHAPSTHVKLDWRHDYVSLLAAHDSSALIPYLDSCRPNDLDLGRLAQQFSDARNYEAQLWALNADGKTSQAIDVSRQVIQGQGADLASAVIDGELSDIGTALGTLDDVVRMSVRISKTHSSQYNGTAGIQAEDCWYGVLHELLEVDHELSGILIMSTKTSEQSKEVEEHLRGLITETLSALVSSSSSKVSFPRLFKRLVEASNDENGAKVKSKKQRQYAQFRSILGGMLESYRAESDMLAMTTRLVQDDLFVAYRQLIEKKQTGWRGGAEDCKTCGEAVLGEPNDNDEVKSRRRLKIQGDGVLLHVECERKM